MRFDISLESKQLTFDSDLRGLCIGGVEYLSGRDGVLIYDQTRDVRGDIVELQMSTNTSTLIPALRVLGIPYAPYFDERSVVDSQNDITFYGSLPNWQLSTTAIPPMNWTTPSASRSSAEPWIF